MWPTPSSCVPGAVGRVASEDAETDTTSCHDDRRYPATNDTRSLGNSPNKISSEGPTAMFVGTADATKDGSAVSANETASRRMPARVCRLRRCGGGPRKTATLLKTASRASVNKRSFNYQRPRRFAPSSSFRRSFRSRCLRYPPPARDPGAFARTTHRRGGSVTSVRLPIVALAVAPVRRQRVRCEDAGSPLTPPKV